jgi:hypothetical protein
MKRKCLAVGIILLFVGTCIIPAQKTHINHDTAPRDGFGLQSVIYLSWDSTEAMDPLEPGGAPRNVTLNVTYFTTLITPYLGRIILLYCLVTHQHVSVTLEIGEIPSWCTASLLNSEFQFPITGTASTQHTTIAVAVNEHAPMYSLCKVPINGSVETMRGPFSLLPFVHGFDQTCIMNFVPGYRPGIIVTPASDYLNTTPGHPSTLSINITNTGNARTAVVTDIVDTPPGNWMIDIPWYVILEVNMSGEMYLTVTPPNDFNGIETITISFTPYLADDPTQHGDPVNITIMVICEP